MRSPSIALSGLVLVSLLLTACAEGADDVAVTTTLPPVDLGSSTTSTSPMETTTTTQATTTTTRATTTTIAGRLIRVVVEGGEVTVAGPTSVTVGEQVTIRVRADVEDQVVVQDYDLSADVAPGSRGDISFTADIPGVHAVELARSGTPLFELEVTG